VAGLAVAGGPLLIGEDVMVFGNSGVKRVRESSAGGNIFVCCKD
jgi:hypothetical protein